MDTESTKVFMIALGVILGFLLLTLIYRFIFRINTICGELEKQSNELKRIADKMTKEEKTEP